MKLSNVETVVEAKMDSKLSMIFFELVLQQVGGWCG
jgi:hypothetical protein